MSMVGLFRSKIKKRNSSMSSEEMSNLAYPSPASGSVDSNGNGNGNGNNVNNNANKGGGEGGTASASSVASSSLEGSSAASDRNVPLQSPQQSQTRQYGTKIISSSGSRRRSKSSSKSKQKQQSPPSIGAVPTFVNDLATAKTTGGERALRALRKLFALSEHASYTENRIEMVQCREWNVAPVLLEFLGRCDKGSSEQYLTLLVLNNVSIPPENKRYLALDCGGAAALSRLLCEDPSCHLIAIVLVNLTFADTDLRSELAAYDADVEIVESLAFALRVASLTQAEYEHRQALVEHSPEDPKTPRELLQSLLAEDEIQRQRSGGGDGDGGGDGGSSSDGTGSQRSSTSSSGGGPTQLLPPASQQLFPETARWALAAIKNLTRPSKDPTAANTLIEIGIVPYILRFVVVATTTSTTTINIGSSNSKSMSRNPSISVSEKSGNTARTAEAESAGESAGEDSYNSGHSIDTPVPSDPEEEEKGVKTSNSSSNRSTASAGNATCNRSTASASSCCSNNEANEDCGCYTNSPTTWDSHSAQDAALFIVLNLCAVPSLREYVREVGSIRLLSRITASERQDAGEHHPFVEEELLEFQRLKARMALSYLVGSVGHFGQPRRKKGGRASTSATTPQAMYGCKDDATLLVTEPEVTRLVELLATTLHRRTKEGAGGYSAATFSVKYVLFALRCLLTNYENQVKFANAQGTQLNTLLMKVLALHSVNDTLYVDAEAAEHACFSLYLVSNYCFKDVAFLPELFGNEKVSEMVSAKVLTAYGDRTDITPAGKHALDQLLLRLRYLHFDGTAADLAVRSGSSTTASDFVLEDDMLRSLQHIYVNPQKPGACPDDDIFDRPLFRRRAVRDQDGNHQKTSQRDSPPPSPLDSYPNALQAVQELSFASTKVRHLDAIDDILIANNIAHSANGAKTESYNCIWTWQDAVQQSRSGGGIEEQRSAESFLPFGGPANAGRDALPGALSLLDNLCGVTGVGP